MHRPKGKDKVTSFRSLTNIGDIFQHSSHKGRFNCALH